MKTKKDDCQNGGIDSALLESLRAICIAEIPKLRLAILFGSCGKGTAQADSDIDLAVLAKNVVSVAERENLIGRVARLTGRPVDLVDLFDVGEPLLNQVLTTGQRFFGSNAEFAQLMMRNVIANADFVPLQRRLLKERRDAWIGN